ncbi:hypothetical protein FY136_06080 [Agrobacterium tumefaciens]|uniref:hypothetical protein n=1 Tax=Agrobacterium tumefaciens TaxID=358 RepID=UPI0021D23DC7|nr:hypothetical protein [Agrobacterium tumefaciens]UXT48831.1 hypothetical protein FY136_06080 [Agrobacterium tumefaciens]
MKGTTIMIAAAMLPTALTAAPEKDYRQAAEELGVIVAAESFCGFKYNHNKLSGYLFSIAPPNERGTLRFGSAFRSSVLRTGEKQTKMNAGAKAIHCGEVKRSAKALKFFR